MTTETTATARLLAEAAAATKAAEKLWLELEAAQGRAVCAWAAARVAARQDGNHATADEADKVARRHGDALDRLRVAFFKMGGRHLCARHD